MGPVKAQHGFARNSEFKLAKASENSATLSLTPTQEQLQGSFPEHTLYVKVPCCPTCTMLPRLPCPALPCPASNRQLCVSDTSGNDASLSLIPTPGQLQALRSAASSQPGDCLPAFLHLNASCPALLVASCPALPCPVQYFMRCPTCPALPHPVCCLLLSPEQVTHSEQGTQSV